MQLADVVEQRTGDHEVAFGLVGVGEKNRDVHDLQDVLEQAAPVRMMDLTGGRPDAQAVRVFAHDRRDEFANGRIGHAGDARFEFGPHFVDGPRGARNAVFFAKSELGVFGNDAPDLVDHEFEALVEEVALPLHGHELADVELRVGRLDVLKYLRADLARHVLEEQHEKRAAAAGPAVLARAQKKSRAARGGVNFGDTRQSSHGGQAGRAVSDRPGKSTSRW